MPAKNSRKLYIENGYYHIYNRGVEKRVIFQDEQDYSVFLSYLKAYLLPKNEKELSEKLSDPTLSSREKNKILKLLRLNNFSDKIRLLAYCLMPNHFHFCLQQKAAESIDVFMNSLGTRYTMYFNRKYNRVGSLYQGVYKAVLVTTDEQLMYLSAYIHKQALASQGEALRIQPCSLPEYLEKRSTEWVYPKDTLSYFSSTNPQLSYGAFVQQYTDHELIQKVIFEDCF